MKRILLLCFCFSTLHLHGQSDVQFFTAGSIYTGFTKEISNPNNYYLYDDLRLISTDFILFAPFPQEPIRINNESMIGIELKAGLILRQKFYVSTGIRYDTRRFTTCYICNQTNPNVTTEDPSIESRAVEIPLSFQYRVIPDLPLSPFLHAESFIAFRKNVEYNIYYNNSSEQQMFGYRLGVGLNYRLGKYVEFNLTGTWGKAKTFEGNFIFADKNDYSYYNEQKLTDYQLSFGLVSKIGK